MSMGPQTETDTMVKIQVPGNKNSGAQIARSLVNLKIGGDHFSRKMIRALGILKKTVALTSYKPGPHKEKFSPIIRVAD